jgi:redox-sensitive bicupin YhaK (pirin superfamily)
MEETTMITVRRSSERGHVNQGWLDTYYTFSFSNYYDPGHMGFRSLRVMNEDRFGPGQGFGTHPHRDMEIVTYVLDGALAHRDSLGHSGVIGRGEFQRMTAGTGIRHSEFNASQVEPVHLYQIWLLPGQEGLTPEYEQRTIPEEERAGRLALVASPNGRDGSLTIRQDARIYLGNLEEGNRLVHPIEPGRHAWLQVLRGGVDLPGLSLVEGDGASISQESSLAISARRDSEVMVFDLA